MAKLNNLICKNASWLKDGSKLSDGRGLYLSLNKNDGKYWRYRYRSPNTGKETTMGLGVYPEVTLQEARLKHAEAHKLVSEGIDPLERKRQLQEQKQREKQATFEVIARAWHKHKSPEWSKVNIKTVIGRLEKEVFPFIGQTPVKELRHFDLIELAERIRNRGANELAKRVVQMCKHVLQYAIVHGHIEKNVAEDLKGYFPSVSHGHFASIEVKELPAFLRDFRENKVRLHRQTYLAIEMLMHTFVRTNELIKAEFSEFDIENRTWLIPAHRMKMKRAHIVPLTSQTIAIVRELKELHGHPKYLFPSRVNWSNHMSNNSILMALRRMGYQGKMTGHGFRSLAKGIIKERLGYRHEIPDLQLAHSKKGDVARAYDRATFLEERVQMMQEYSDYLGKVK